jgi:hypothetical protein
MKIKQLYLRVKYRKQLKQGFKLLNNKDKKEFVIVNSRAFITNGVDPMVRVDLTSGKAEAYVAEKDTYKITYKVTKYESKNN